MSTSLEHVAFSMRARVWLQRHSLDRRLAAGASPADSDELAQRAEQLVSYRSRRALAAHIRDLLLEAEAPPPPLSAAAPLERRAILAYSPELLRLARTLESPDCPVNAPGVARLQLLVTDGGSPIFAPSSEAAIDNALRHIRIALFSN